MVYWVRVVSLVPSMTETLLASSIDVVGVTRYCEVDGYPIIGGTKDPAIDRIVEIDPDLVILDKHENRLEDYEALIASGLTVFATSIASIDDLDRDFSELNFKFHLALPVPSKEITGLHLTKYLSNREFPITPCDPSGAVQRPIRALVPIWRNPYMVINSHTYAGDLLRRIGVEVIGGISEYSKVDLDDFKSRVDVVLAPSEPYKFTKRQLPELTQVAPKVEFVDGKDLFWWGARTSSALIRLKAQLTHLVEELEEGTGNWPQAQSQQRQAQSFD